MCGIVGYTGERQCTPVLLEGLRSLEYRGYDSSGLAVLDTMGIRTVRATGNLDALEAELNKMEFSGTAGIGHTRWATHGKPCELNAHPHSDCSGDIWVVHNGIIENFIELRTVLRAAGHLFTSETDSEVIAHLIEDELRAGADGLVSAVRAALARVTGSYAIAAVRSSDPDQIVAARKNSPLVLGVGVDENFLASSTLAMIEQTRRILTLEDNEIAKLTPDAVTIFDATGQIVNRSPEEVAWSGSVAERGDFDDFMLKEIHEQPDAFRNTLRGRLRGEEVFLDELKMSPSELEGITKIVIIACGTSYHAGMVGKYAIEKWARIPVEIDVASEFRYRNPLIDETALVIAISQSGETADTLAGVVQAKQLGARVLSVVNVVGSQLAKEADALILTQAGPEIGVAATKTFTSQLAAMYLVGLFFARARGTLGSSEYKRIAGELMGLPEKMERTLGSGSGVSEATELFFDLDDFLYLGRGMGYPVALEGALKMKEISYIHAEGYAAGEMKHGPIALIEEGTPVIAMATGSSVQDKVLSNVQESMARGAKIILVANEGDSGISEYADVVFQVPECDETLSPVLETIPLQLFSYQVAKRRGCNVDQPRNLAKSVTVE